MKLSPSNVSFQLFTQKTLVRVFLVCITVLYTHHCPRLHVSHWPSGGFIMGSTRLVCTQYKNKMDITLSSNPVLFRPLSGLSPFCRACWALPINTCSPVYVVVRKPSCICKPPFRVGCVLIGIKHHIKTWNRTLIGSSTPSLGPNWDRVLLTRELTQHTYKEYEKQKSTLTQNTSRQNQMEQIMFGL